MQDGLGAAGEPFGAIGAKHNQVSLFAHFERTDAVGHSDGVGGINGVQGQGIDRAHDGRVHVAIANKTSE